MAEKNERCRKKVTVRRRRLTAWRVTVAGWWGEKIIHAKPTGPGPPQCPGENHSSQPVSPQRAFAAGVRPSAPIVLLDTDPLAEAPGPACAKPESPRGRRVSEVHCDAPATSATAYLDSSSIPANCSTHSLSMAVPAAAVSPHRILSDLCRFVLNVCAVFVINARMRRGYFCTT